MSPRPGPRRDQVAVRMSEAGIQKLDSLAREAQLFNAKGQPHRSEMIRRLLRLALADPKIRRQVVKPEG